MKKIVAIAALVALVSCAPKAQHHLTILHVNDTHSHFEPIRSEMMSEPAA